MEQNQNKDTNETQKQQNQPPPITPQIINQEPQSTPQEIPTKNTRENILKQVVDDSKDQNQANIPEISEEWLGKLWSKVEQAKQDSNTFVSAPMEEIYADPNQCKYDTNSICGYIGSVESQESIDEYLNKMPQYLGEHEAKFEIRVLPLVHGKKQKKKRTPSI